VSGQFIRTVAEVDRFLTSIDFGPGLGACYPWTGGTFDSGYPRFSLSDARRTSVRAHRYGWKLLRGPIPPKLVVCHSCDFRLCMNMWHWFLGTNAVNSADMVAKGRSLPGVRNPAVKLTDADVRVIKYELLPLVATGSGRTCRGQLTLQAIADRYGVSAPAIRAIRAGLTWTHI